MQYKLAFGYFIGKKPTGWTNLLLLFVCLLIPAVGLIVALGYRAEVAERLLRDPDLRRYPDFSFDRFMEFLQRGLWPFLVYLLSVVVMVPLAVIFMFAFPVILTQVKTPAAAVVTFGLLFLFFLCVSFVVSAVLTPMMFHAELANRFDLGGALRFTVSFWKLVAGPAIVAAILYFILATAVSFVGMLACFVGVYPASVVTMMAGQHIMVQLYQEYLDRGGEEIVKTEPDSDRRRRDDDYDDDPEADDYDDRPRRR